MHTFLHFIGLTLISTGIMAADRGPAIPDYPTDRVADNVYVIHGPLTIPNPENQGFMNNPGIVITAAGVVILDPGGTVQSGEMVLRAIKKLTNKPVVAVFNSHIHGDHWLGNQAVKAAYPEVVIYAHPNMIAEVETGEGDVWIELMEQLTEGKSKGTTVIAPTRAINHGDEIKVGKLTFRIHHYGQAHTKTDIMVEIVEPGVVFLGDNVLNGRVPRMAEGDIKGNILACTEIVKTGSGVYVPGHGKSGDRKVVDIMHTWFNTIYTIVERLYDEGLSDFEMKDEITQALGDYTEWIGFNEQLGKHISYSYLQVEESAF